MVDNMRNTIVRLIKEKEDLKAALYRTIEAESNYENALVDSINLINCYDKVMPKLCNHPDIRLIDDPEIKHYHMIERARSRIKERKEIG